MMSEAKNQFAWLAVQYYVAGRYAAIVQLIPVLGNLLHHAVEMALKASLADRRTLGDLKRLGHGLPNTWADFKSLHPDPRAIAFDAIVTNLQKFEEVRYPDSIVEKGADCLAGRSTPLLGGWSS